MQTQATSFKVAKIRLLERQMSIADLARKMGLARNTVSLAINHETMFPGVQERIRQELDLP